MNQSAMPTSPMLARSVRNVEMPRSNRMLQNCERFVATDRYFA